jgi:hypothetical protein
MFFDHKDCSAPSLSMEHFREWAGAIANSYLATGITPTDSLVKIAQSEELTPHQVFVLAGEANKTIHQYKYAKADDKYLAADFPLADAQQAISRLQADGGVLKVAVADAAPQYDDGYDPYQAFGIKPETQDKTASVKTHLKVAAQKAESVLSSEADKTILAKYAAESAETAFIKLARQMVLAGDTSADRMKHLGHVDHFVKQAGLKAIAARPLAKLAYVLKQEGLLMPVHAEQAFEYFTKEADQKAPDAFISEWLDSRVVNGQHPLYITLKTFQNACAARDLHSERHTLVDDRIRMMHQKVRAL